MAAKDIWKPGWTTASGRASRTAKAATARALKLIARRSRSTAANTTEAVIAARSAGGGEPETTR